MTLNFDKMALVVTGAASGIGRAVALGAAAQGVSQILAVDRNTSGLASLVEQLDGAAQVVPCVADLADVDAAGHVGEAARDAFGRIDALVNAAGITTRADFLDCAPELFDLIFAVNTRAPFFLMQQAIADMRRRDAPGAIVNIQSINAHCGAAELAPYSASKGALQTLTKNAANAHRFYRIRVNGLNLGWVDSEAEHQMQAETLGKGADWASKAGAAMPNGRLIQPEEAANAALFLLGPASFPTTGVNLDFEQWVVGSSA